MGIRTGIYASTMNTIPDNYLRILAAGQDDVLASLETGNPKDFFAALERHKALTESVKNGVDAYMHLTYENDGSGI
jgi:hypothetical protein